MKILILALTLFPLLAFSKGYGIVTLVKGNATVLYQDGSKSEIKKGVKIYESDTVVTAPTAIVRIVMMDTGITREDLHHLEVRNNVFFQLIRTD